MPFQPTLPGLPMQRNPAVRIFFHGLLILRASGTSRYSVVEVHQTASYPHILSVEVRTKIQGSPDVIAMRHFGPLEPPGMTIDVDPAPTVPIVYKHQPSGVFDPILGGGLPDDFGWIPDLQTLHRPKSLSVDITKTRPAITIGNGIYYFHTAQLRNGPIGVKQGHVSKSNLAGLASIVGANVYLDDTSKIVLKWTENGSAKDLRLGKPEPNSYHEIYVDNSPLYEAPSGGATHSELREYYAVLVPSLPFEETFNLEFPNLVAESDSLTASVSLDGSAKFDRRGTPRIPCMPIVLDG